MEILNNPHKHRNIKGRRITLKRHIFFLVRLYNSQCRVLAFSTTSFHLLSWTKVFQFGTFNFCISFLTSSSQRNFGLPVASLKSVSRSVMLCPFLFLAFFRYDHTNLAFALWRSLLRSYVLLFCPIPGQFLFGRIHFHRLGQIFSSKFSFQKPLVY